MRGRESPLNDVLAETQAGATPEQLAQWYELDVVQIQMALRYIEEHQEAVLRDWQEFQAHHGRRHPPEFQAKLEAIAAKYGSLWEARRRALEQESNGEWPPRGY